uniref:TGS domain-containing protein n=1 Tax=Fervidicoccus fontis TaxID=683846 RepID=A0A7J3ZNB9_9CREN
MPTNLPPEARAKWIKVMEARSPEEKIRALQEFISAVPKHKGTEKLLYWARRRLRELREEIEDKKKKRSGSRGPTFFIEKEGAAQAVMVGEPNSGKTLLLSRLTNVRVEIVDYPFSTQAPKPGMLFVRDVPIQIVDTPSIVFSGEGPKWTSRVLGLARNADALMLVIDMSRNPVVQLKRALERLEEYGILLRKPKAHVGIERTSSGGINVIVNGKIVDGSIEDVKKMLRDYRIHHAIVRIFGEALLEDIEATVLGARSYKPSIIVANKMDLQEARENFYKLVETKEFNGLNMVPVSAKTGENLSQLGFKLVEVLELIRVYTKQPGGEVARTPLVLRRGATVMDVAKSIHSEIAKNFKYARVWGKSVRLDGERVGSEHVVEDGDIVEIHAKA